MSNRDKLQQVGSTLTEKDILTARLEKQAEKIQAQSNLLVALTHRVEMLEKLLSASFEKSLLSSASTDKTTTEKASNLEKNETDLLLDENASTIVDSLLAQNATNFSWLPDFMERPLDRRIIRLVMGLLIKVLDTGQVNWGNHTLAFSAHPLVKHQDQTQNENVETVNQKPKLDDMVGVLLKSLLSNLSVDLLGLEIEFHFDKVTEK